MTDEHHQLEQIPPAPDTYRVQDINFVKDPHETLRKMREQSRIHRAVSPFYHLGMPGHDVVTHYDDASELLRSRAHIVDLRKLPEGDPRRRDSYPGWDDALPPSLVVLDPPEHDRIRGLVNKAFTPRAIEALKPRIAEIAHELLDAADGQTEIDFIETLASPLPVMVIAELIGVAAADRDRFETWINTTATISPEDFKDEESTRRWTNAANQASNALTDYFRGQIELRRIKPGNDLISRLIEVEEEEDRIAEPEIIALCKQLLGAGIVVTTAMLGNGLLALLRHPDQMQLLRNDRELVPSAVEEMLRYAPPAAGPQRLMARDTEIGGCPVGMHRGVLASVVGANRDPAVFEDPDRFDVTRTENRHLTFGAGLHYCIGAPLARAQAQAVLHELLDRYEHIEAGIPFGDVEFRWNGNTLGVPSLPLRVS